jgi:DNA-directed RNA polymerase specialized sigma24 family protein
MNATKPLQEADTKDIVQLTFERAMRARKWPKTEAPMVTWLKAITDSAYKDHFRKKGRTDDVEETRADVHEMADAKAPISDIAELTHEEAVKLAAESPENARAFEMLKETRVEDAKVITIARERGLKKNTASHQINSFAEKVRNRVRARLAEIGAAAAVGFAMILLLLHGGGEGTGVGAGRGVPHPSDPLPELPTVLSPQMLRDLAHEYCYEDRYGMCLEYLDRARRLDPAGDIDPRVVEERRRAEIELREHGEKNPR